ncbi:hypothetical protein P7C70_g9246, partial [Phenoliferia sp. Uapishka_3]
MELNPIQQHLESTFTSDLLSLSIAISALPLPLSSDPPWLSAHLFHRLSQQPSPAWSELHPLLKLEWSSPWQIKPEDMVGGSDGVARVWEVMQKIGSTGLARKEVEDVRDAEIWIRALVAKCEERTSRIEKVVVAVGFVSKRFRTYFADKYHQNYSHILSRSRTTLAT